MGSFPRKIAGEPIRVSRLHDNLEGGRLCEDVFCRRIPVGLEFIGHEPNAHSKAVDEVEGLSHCVENLEQFCRRNDDGCGWEMLCVPGYQV